MVWQPAEAEQVSLPVYGKRRTDRIWKKGRKAEKDEKEHEADKRDMADDSVCSDRNTLYCSDDFLLWKDHEGRGGFCR